jgi:glutathione S-transferase
MAALTLVVGNRNYSSWSLRPWALLTHLGLDFDLRLIPLRTATFAAEVAPVSPTGRVPVLVHGELVVHESLAILEYVSELAGGRGWPRERERRARARAVATEMHGGFTALRRALPMNLRARGRQVARSAEVAADVRRLDALWSDCRERHGAEGPWLFGEYSAADAMYLPVAMRFRSYGTEGLGEAARAYVDASVADPLIRPWVLAAEAETARIEDEEVGIVAAR